MTLPYNLNNVNPRPAAAATQNACKLCSPLGAALVFKGISGAIPLLHGSQGCSTYIRRYLISHFKEPIDIACSNFGEQTAIFGGGANIKLALDNIIVQYSPAMIGVATTCLAETIGDDVPMFIHQFKESNRDKTLPPIVNVSTPSYAGTHMQGFHRAVAAVIRALAENNKKEVNEKTVNLFPGMVSPADLRYLKDIVADFGLKGMILPDYSKTLDGDLWAEYQRIPGGGTPVEDIVAAGGAAVSIEMGAALAKEKNTAATYLNTQFDVSAYRLGMPIGIRETDRFLLALSEISGAPIPVRYEEERGRLLDALVDGHKYVNNLRVVVYGEADLLAGLVSFMSEVGIIPVICATGDNRGSLSPVIEQIVEPRLLEKIQVIEGADFVDIEGAVKQAQPDMIIGHSKGYSLSRRLGIPLVRIGFPVHDRVGGSRMLHLGYQGTQSLFDRIANTVLERRQSTSAVGYTYM